MPSNAVRREGPADRLDRGRRPGRVLRAEAALQRPVRRRREQAGRAVEHASEGRSARRLLHRADRQGRDRAQGQRGHDGRLRHDDLRLRGRGEGARHRRRDHRRAHDGAARRRHDLHVGQEDRPLPDRARGDALLAASAPSCRRRSRKSASGTSRRRSAASPAGTRRIRTRSSGSTSRARCAWPRPSRP